MTIRELIAALQEIPEVRRDCAIVVVDPRDEANELDIDLEFEFDGHCYNVRLL